VGRGALKVLVTGGGGRLGRELRRAFGDVDVVAADHAALDIGDRDATVGAITSLRPDIVVNAAAIANVDACETDPDLAFRVNALGVRNVADGARRVGAHVVHISTDYVFDGESERAYLEWDDCAPVQVYGRSKRAGELELDPGSTIVRSTWLFGPTGGMARMVLDAAATGPGPLRFIDDQIACPTAFDQLADKVRELAVARLPGTFHVTNQGETSPYEIARTVLAAAGMDPARVEPISTVDHPRPARRPRHSALDNAALRLSGPPLLPDHREPLERLVKELTA
jgi:dTDP-4-dehydrorhamnose reductase